MNRTTHTRGFTLVELAICLTLMAILVPMIYSYALGIEDRTAMGMWHLQTADGTRTLTETLQRDARQGVLQPGEAVGFVRGDCQVSWQVQDATLLRTDSCGTTQGIARDVAAITREDGGISVVFSRSLRAGSAHTEAIFVPLEVR